MKQFLLLIFTLCISVVFLFMRLVGQNRIWYICKQDPYIKFIYDYNIGYMTTQKLR